MNELGLEKKTNRQKRREKPLTVQDENKPQILQRSKQSSKAAEPSRTSCLSSTPTSKVAKGNTVKGGFSQRQSGARIRKTKETPQIAESSLIKGEGLFQPLPEGLQDCNRVLSTGVYHLPLHE